VSLLRGGCGGRTKKASGFPFPFRVSGLNALSSDTSCALNRNAGSPGLFLVSTP